MPRETLTTTKFQMYGVDTIHVDYHEIFVPVFERRTKSARGVTQPHTKAEITQGSPFKEGPVPFLKYDRLIEFNTGGEKWTHLNNMQRITSMPFK